MEKLAIEISRLDIDVYENNLHYDEEGQLCGDISYKVNKDDLKQIIKDELDNNEDFILGYKLDITGTKDVSPKIKLAKHKYMDIEIRVDEIKHIDENIILIMEIL